MLPPKEAIDSGIAAIAAEMPRCDAERHGAELYGAPRFSVFSLFGDKETTLSKVLADLFDPKGAHGQGQLFLNSLLKIAGEKPISRLDRSVRVRTEAPVSVSGRKAPRRIDILVETSDRLIGIENKKWTGESENQLGDYWSYLQANAGQLTPHLIFISDAEPSEENATRVPYFEEDEDKPSIDRMLRQAREGAKANRIRDFIDDFSGWIGRTFAGKESTEMDVFKETVTDLMKKGGSTYKAIGAVLVAQDAIVRDYVRRVEGYILDGIREEFDDIEVCLHDGIQYPLDEWIDDKWEAWKIRRPSWPKNVGLAIESGRGGWEQLYYGMYALDPASKDGCDPAYAHYVSERFAEVSDVVHGYGSNMRSSQWWPWLHDMPTFNWTNEAIGEAMASDEAFPGERLGVGKVRRDFIGLARAISSIDDK